MQYYIPFGQERGFGGTQLLVRPRGRVEATTAAIDRVARALDPSVTVVDVSLLQDSVDPLIRPWRLGATMFTLMGALALIVAVVGLYSVMAYLVAQRTHELGIRFALGARPLDVVRLVLRSGVTLAATGIVLGLAAALLLGRFIAPLLFDTSPHDVGVFGVVAISLLVAALLASAIPAWRAKAVSPLEALRAD